MEQNKITLISQSKGKSLAYSFFGLGILLIGLLFLFKNITVPGILFTIFGALMCFNIIGYFAKPRNIIFEILNEKLLIYDDHFDDFVKTLTPEKQQKFYKNLSERSRRYKKEIE